MFFYLTHKFYTVYGRAMENTQNTEMTARELKAESILANLKIGDVCADAGIRQDTFSHWVSERREAPIGGLQAISQSIQKLKGQKT